MNYLIFLSIALLAFSGCGKVKVNIDQSPSTSNKVQSVKMVDDINPADWPSDPFYLKGARIIQDTLIIEVEYSGGCEKHDFNLMISRSFLESMPVQATTLLTHKDPNDPCDGIEKKTVYMDLTPLKAAYKKAYQTTQNNEIDISLNGKEQSITVKYRF